jgi:hypothetical protein
MKAFQDYYPENVSHCYGCGSQNQHGHRIRLVVKYQSTVFRPSAFSAWRSRPASSAPAR